MQQLISFENNVPQKMRASAKDLHSPVKILSHVSSDIWWAGKFMKITTSSGEMFLTPVTAGRELETGFGASAEHLQLGGNFCKEFSFQSYRGRFFKVFLSWSFWESLSLTHLQQAAFLLSAPSFRSAIIITWWIMHLFSQADHYFTPNLSSENCVGYKQIDID